MKHFLLLALIVITIGVTAQTPEFYKTYGTPSSVDFGQSVCQTKDGGYIASGRSSSFGAGSEDVYLIKTDTKGDTLWSEQIGCGGNCYGYTIRVAPDNGYLVSGHTDCWGHGDCDGLFFKADSTGRIVWMTTYGTPVSEITSSFSFTNDKGYILIGYHGAISDVTGQVYLVKSDINGDTLWTKYYGTEASTLGYYVCQTADTGYVFTGYSTNYGQGKADIILGKTDSKGNLQWWKTFGGDSDDVAYCMQITKDGGYILAGYTDSYGNGNSDGYVIKTDAEGNKLWAKTYGGPKLDRFNHIELTYDGGYILSGMTKSYGAGGADMYVVKIDSLGNQQWMQAYGDTADQVNGGIKQCADSGYIIVGSSSNNCQPTGNYNVLLIKTDKNGAVVTSVPNIQETTYSINPYPNPFSQTETFPIPDKLQNRLISLVIYDATGNEVINHPDIINTNAIQLSRNGMVQGVYFYEFHEEDRIVATGKIVVQN
jgi:hypothetical protein